MNLHEKIGREIESNMQEIEMIFLPKYGRGSCVVKGFETENGCWNIQVDFNVENGGIDSLCFESSDNSEREPFCIDEIDDIKSLYPDLFENITSAIFENIK